MMTRWFPPISEQKPERPIATEILMALSIFQCAETSVREKHRQAQLPSECTARHIMPAGEDGRPSPAGPHGTTRSSGANCPCRWISQSDNGPDCYTFRSVQTRQMDYCRYLYDSVQSVRRVERKTKEIFPTQSWFTGSGQEKNRFLCHSFGRMRVNDVSERKRTMAKDICWPKATSLPASNRPAGKRATSLPSRRPKDWERRRNIYAWTHIPLNLFAWIFAMASAETSRLSISDRSFFTTGSEDASITFWKNSTQYCESIQYCLDNWHGAGEDFFYTYHWTVVENIMIFSSFWPAAHIWSTIHPSWIRESTRTFCSQLCIFSPSPDCPVRASYRHREGRRKCEDTCCHCWCNGTSGNPLLNSPTTG